MNRKNLAALVLWLGAALACAVNPVTGKKEFMLYSEGQEIELGKQTDESVAAQYGLYDDAALQGYISKMGLAIAAKSQRPGLPWRFSVLDSPVVNAFAVPGGSVYVTRGILAMMSSEAELAAVLGHEIGHVNARHSMSQMSKQQVAQIGLVAGSVISKKFAQYAGLASAGLQVLFLKYSRDNENQADALGVGYSRATGYDPADMAVTFRALQRMGDMSGGSSLPGFLSTHPLTADRIANVQAMLQPQDASLARRPEAYLRTVEDVVYGEDPRQGYVENSVFYHPGLRFQFAVPSGWTVENTPGSVTLVAADQSAGVVMRGGKSTDSPQEYARKAAETITQSGGKLVEEKSATFNGLAGYEQGLHDRPGGPVHDPDAAVLRQEGGHHLRLPGHEPGRRLFQVRSELQVRGGLFPGPDRRVEDQPRAQAPGPGQGQRHGYAPGHPQKVGGDGESLAHVRGHERSRAHGGARGGDADQGDQVGGTARPQSWGRLMSSMSRTVA